MGVLWERGEARDSRRWQGQGEGEGEGERGVHGTTAQAEGRELYRAVCTAPSLGKTRVRNVVEVEGPAFTKVFLPA